jgi:hypothetical protein
VLIDPVTSPRFDTAVPGPMDDTAPQPMWQPASDSVVLVGGSNIGGLTPPDAHDEADFLRPPGWRSV